MNLFWFVFGITGLSSAQQNTMLYVWNSSDMESSEIWIGQYSCAAEHKPEQDHLWYEYGKNIL